jgi:hypothetical protein
VNRGFEWQKENLCGLLKVMMVRANLLENLILPLEKDESLVLSFCQSLLVTKDSKIIYKTENQFLEEKVPDVILLLINVGDPVLVNAVWRC